MQEKQKNRRSAKLLWWWVRKKPNGEVGQKLRVVWGEFSVMMDWLEMNCRGPKWKGELCVFTRKTDQRESWKGLFTGRSVPIYSALPKMMTIYLFLLSFVLMIRRRADLSVRLILLDIHKSPHPPASNKTSAHNVIIMALKVILNRRHCNLNMKSIELKPLEGKAPLDDKKNKVKHHYEFVTWVHGFKKSSILLSKLTSR